MLFSVRCGRVNRVPVLVVEGRAAWLRGLSFLGLGWRPRFRGLVVSVVEVRGVVRLVVAGGLHRLKRRRRVVSWLWSQVEVMVLSELTRIAVEGLVAGMNRPDAEALGAAIARRAARGAKRTGREVEVVFAELMGEEHARLGQKVLARGRVEAAAVEGSQQGLSVDALRRKVTEVFRAQGFSRRELLGVRL